MNYINLLKMKDILDSNTNICLNDKDALLASKINFYSEDDSNLNNSKEAELKNVPRNFIKFNASKKEIEDIVDNVIYFNEYLVKASNEDNKAIKKPLPCSYGCGKFFNEKGNLMTHERIHNSFKPFKCPYIHCNDSFKAHGHLKDHMKKHFDIKPYKCLICNEKFSRNSTLKMHMNTHVKTKPYKCPILTCDKYFVDKAQIKYHMKNHYRNSKDFESIFFSYYNKNKEQIKNLIKIRNSEIEEKFKKFGSSNPNLPKFIRKKNTYDLVYYEDGNLIVDTRIQKHLIKDTGIKISVQHKIKEVNETDQINKVEINNDQMQIPENSISNKKNIFDIVKINKVKKLNLQSNEVKSIKINEEDENCDQSNLLVDKSKLLDESITLNTNKKRKTYFKRKNYFNDLLHQKVNRNLELNKLIKEKFPDIYQNLENEIAANKIINEKLEDHFYKELFNISTIGAINNFKELEKLKCDEKTIELSNSDNLESRLKSNIDYEGISSKKIIETVEKMNLIEQSLNGINCFYNINSSGSKLLNKDNSEEIKNEINTYNAIDNESYRNLLVKNEHFCKPSNLILTTRDLIELSKSKISNEQSIYLERELEKMRIYLNFRYKLRNDNLNKNKDSKFEDSVNNNKVKEFFRRQDEKNGNLIFNLGYTLNKEEIKDLLHKTSEILTEDNVTKVNGSSKSKIPQVNTNQNLMFLIKKINDDNSNNNLINNIENNLLNIKKKFNDSKINSQLNIHIQEIYNNLNVSSSKSNSNLIKSSSIQENLNENKDKLLKFINSNVKKEENQNYQLMNELDKDFFNNYQLGNKNLFDSTFTNKYPPFLNRDNLNSNIQFDNDLKDIKDLKNFIGDNIFINPKSSFSKYQNQMNSKSEKITKELDSIKSICSSKPLNNNNEKPITSRFTEMSNNVNNYYEKIGVKNLPYILNSGAEFSSLIKNHGENINNANSKSHNLIFRNKEKPNNFINNSHDDKILEINSPYNLQNTFNKQLADINSSFCNHVNIANKFYKDIYPNLKLNSPEELIKVFSPMPIIKSDN